MTEETWIETYLPLSMYQTLKEKLEYGLDDSCGICGQMRWREHRHECPWVTLNTLIESGEDEARWQQARQDRLTNPALPAEGEYRIRLTTQALDEEYPRPEKAFYSKDREAYLEKVQSNAARGYLYQAVEVVDFEGNVVEYKEYVRSGEANE